MSRILSGTVVNPVIGFMMEVIYKKVGLSQCGMRSKKPLAIVSRMGYGRREGEERRHDG
jgi:hypothetical protein